MNEPALRRRNVPPSGSAPPNDERTPLLAKNIPSGWTPAPTTTALATTYSDSTLQWLKDFISNLLQQACKFLWFWSPAPTITTNESFISPAAREAVQQLRVNIRTDQYDKANPIHEDSLMRLWNVSFPTVPLECRITKQWGKLGFQGTDPATDFRGGGMFSLRNLLYLADQYPSHYQRMLHSTAGERYPFAITGINITNVLFEILGWGMKPQQTTPEVREKLISLLVGGSRGSQIQQDSFEELYCAAFVIFDREWTSMRASYMDFPKVMESARQKFEKLLVDSASLEDLRLLLGERSGVTSPAAPAASSLPPQQPQPDLISFN